MDNKKIGKLIAKLRNEQGLTQQELGDKIGVGFRAVSKWERGLTLPDISNINELSKILGISSDELLSGELKAKEEQTEENSSKNKKKISRKTKIIISVITLLILTITTTIIYYNDKTYVYDITSTNEDENHIEGKVTFKGKNISIMLNKLYFIDDNFASTIITNYQYEIISNDTFIFGYGQNSQGKVIEKEYTIQEFTDSFKINYSSDTYVKRKVILKNNIYLYLTMWDTNSKEIKKKIEIMLYK